MSAEPTAAGLIARVRAGDADALTELFTEYAQQVFDTAMRITGSHDDAEDVVQDVFLGMPEALPGYRGDGSLGAWIRRLATRTALLRIRREKRRHRWYWRAASARRASEPPPAVSARLTLQWALDRMPDELRVVYVLKEVEGYSHIEIAELLGISEGASTVRLHRARRFLRERLKGRI